jgi:gliding motility-associated-like protein
MPLQRIFYAICVLVPFFVSIANAQPVADFEIGAGEDAVCVNENVHFTNTSDVSGCSSDATYTWSFDDGQTSTEQNPVYNWDTPGDYNVVLTVTCGVYTDAEAITISVLSTPDAEFQVSSFTGCAPYTATFNNLTTQEGSGTIDQFVWTFGDGNTSNEENPEYTFVNPGSYTVSLEAINVNGCSDFFSLEDVINLSTVPQISLSASPQSWCQSPVDVNFSSNITLAPDRVIDNISWDFGDGGSATGEENPMHTYNNNGDFDVQLTVTDDYGCSNTIDSIDYVHVHPVTPDYEVYNWNSEEITDGVTCLNQVTNFFCNNEGYGVEWDFGGGSTSTSLSPQYIFNSAENHTITLTVDPDGTCEASTSFQLEVEDPTPTISVDDDFACNPPFEVQFTGNAAVDIEEYEWLFGDGASSTMQNPSHIYGSNGMFTPVLEVTSSHGCTAQADYQSINISSASAAFSVDTVEGCLGVSMTATYDSITDPAAIVDFTWDFYSNHADLSSPFSGATQETHVYTDTGEFVIELTVTDTSGCESVHTVDVQVGEHQNPLFDTLAYPHLICPQDSLNFWSESTDSSYIDDYAWLFGDTASWQWGTSDQHHVQDYMFEEDTGYVQVVHVVNHNGCRDSLYMPEFFYVRGPIINNIEINHDCSLGNMYQFTLDHTLAEYWDWYVFDDAGTQIAEFPDNTNETLSYDFPGTGDYWVHAVAHNDTSGCDYRDSVPVNVIQPLAAFDLPDPDWCSGQPYDFDESGSQNAESFMWDFGDGETTDWSPTAPTTHTYDTLGDMEVWLHVMDENGCEDSVMHVLHISGPMLTLTSMEQTGCAPFDAYVAGNVASDYEISYISAQLVGFGTQDTVPSGSDSVDFAFAFDDLPAGEYELIIQAAAGYCPQVSWSFPLYVDVVSLDAAFTGESLNDQDQQLCVGDEVEFLPDDSDVHDTDVYDYEWDFGDGSPVSTELNPTHTYNDTGSFDVSLTISGNGCIETEVQNQYIEVQDANANFSLSFSGDVCPEFSINQDSINIEAEEVDGYTYTWDPGYASPLGNGYDAYNFPYDEPGDYYLEFTVETPFGCTDSHSEFISVTGGSANLYVNDQLTDDNSSIDICLGDTLNFKVDDMVGVDSVEWTFGTGASSTSYVTQYAFNEPPTTGNHFRVDARISGSGCHYSLTVYVVVNIIQADFTMMDPEYGIIADTMQCSPFGLDLINNAVGQPYDPDNIHWYVEGGGDNANTADGNWYDVNFVNNTQQDSIVDISLVASNASVGCADSITKQVVIGYIPDPNITPDTIVCEGDALSLHAEGGGSYVWYPGLYLSDTEVAEPEVLPEEDMTYSVTVTADNGCANSDSMHVSLQHPVESTLASEYDTINIGESISNAVSYDQDNVSILWTPDEAISCVDCDNPTFLPMETTHYSVEISDSMQCFTSVYDYELVVDVKYTLDVPKAFTPEGSPQNRVVFVRGIGIKDLKEFSIYNRWGEQLFRTDDINHGWDGYYKGKLQPVDTYVYYVEAEMYNGETESKKGTIMLIQ